MASSLLQADTICAIATAPGEAGIGLVRLSGPDAIAAADRIVRLANGRPLETVETHRLIYGRIVDPQKGEVLDEVLVAVMRAPRSYTREDVVEISCHGGPWLLHRVISLLISPDVRLADPGEFTRRAFLNGRLDLAQAEAVIDVIRAQTEGGFRAAARQLGGGLSSGIRALQDQLVGLLTEVEASIDFSEEGLEFLSEEKIKDVISQVHCEVRHLIATADRGKLIREGASVVIVGRPNVGKSSLLNGILRENRAIVTPHPGTTRDTIEETADLGGQMVRISDTAGLHETLDVIEQEGIRRTEDAVASADLLLIVFDRSELLNDADERMIDSLRGRRAIAVLNKADLVAAFDSEAITARLDVPAVPVCALTGHGLDLLIEKIRNMLEVGQAAGDGVYVTRVRHLQALHRVDTSLSQLEDSLADGAPHECIALDLRVAIDAFGEILGTVTTDDILHEIFSKFCIGK